MAYHCGIWHVGLHLKVRRKKIKAICIHSTKIEFLLINRHNTKLLAFHAKWETSIPSLIEYPYLYIKDRIENFFDLPSLSLPCLFPRHTFKFLFQFKTVLLFSPHSKNKNDPQAAWAPPGLQMWCSLVDGSVVADGGWGWLGVLWIHRFISWKKKREIKTPDPETKRAKEQGNPR